MDPQADTPQIWSDPESGVMGEWFSDWGDARYIASTTLMGTSDFPTTLLSPPSGEEALNLLWVNEISFQVTPEFLYSPVYDAGYPGKEVVIYKEHMDRIQGKCRFDTALVRVKYG